MKFNTKFSIYYLTIALLLLPLQALAADIYSVQLYFGLSVPDGSNVTNKQWEQFVSNSITKRFDGFNIVDSRGYWKGKPEPSKIVTIIVKQEQLKDIEVIAKDYAQQFHQDSVMLVQSPVENLKFVEGK